MSDALQILREQTPERLARFAELFFSDLDASQAAAAVGAPGKEREMLADRRVLAFVSALAGHRQEVNLTVRQAAIAQLSALASFDPAGAVAPGSLFLKPMDEMPPAVRFAIESWEVKPDGSFKVKFVPRLQVIRLLLEVTGAIQGDGNPTSTSQKVVIQFRGREEM